MVWNMDTPDNKETKNFFYAISLGLELGFLIVLPLVVFLLIGLFLDKKFKQRLRLHLILDYY